MSDISWDEFDQMRDSASEDIEAADVEVQALAEDIEDYADQVASGGQEVADLFVDVYELSDD